MKKNRISGIMRIKNDGMFVEKCIESCIDALDELIIVHNDCTDNSVEEIEKMRVKYPDKIHRYEYPYRIYGINLTKNEYEDAKKLPEDSPHLLCTYCNFALSKVTSEYALKIDADQVYFSDQMKLWCDFIRNMQPQKKTLQTIIGYGFQKYISLYRLLSIKCNRVLPLIPNWMLKIFYPMYLSYAKYAFSHGEACLSLSGVNVLEDNGNTLISMGHKLDDFMSGFPFNGEGDTVIFKNNEQTYFRKFVMDNYNTGATSYSIIEQFCHPYRIMYIGFFWKHIRAMRPGVYERSLQLKKKDPTAYLSIDAFEKLSYKQIMKHSTIDVFRMFQRILFGFIYKSNKEQLVHSFKESEKTDN